VACKHKMTILLNKHFPLIPKLKREVGFLLGKLIGWEKHQRVVIVSRSRSGSNMLCSFLESHPDCFMWREIFRRPQYFTPNITYFLTGGKYLRKFKVVGYKVFYNHNVPNNYWDEIISDNTIRIIHLVRQNHLSTFVSQREATASAKWQTFKDSEKHLLQRKLKVDTDDMVSFLTRNEIMISSMNNRLQARRNVLQLSYEELIDGSGKRKVSNFLEGALNPKKYGIPENKKQSYGSVSDRIENIEEVEVTLRKFGWEHFTTNE
jgi:hypothetical protein